MPPVPPSSAVLSLKEQLIQESCSMVRHLVTNGTRVPAQLVHTIDQFEMASEQGRRVDVVALAAAHERLARLVAPAKPGTLYLLDEAYHPSGQISLGPVKLVRDLVRVAMACVAVFIVLSVVELVDAHAAIDVFGVEPPTGPVRGEATGDNHTMMVIKIILERVFWLSAAGIGASFAMLFQLNDQIVSRTYDPDETASYWVKFFLGVVAGFILVALVPIDTGAVDTGAEALGPPTIALLGGFSASAVYRILTRMVEALESIFSGGAKEQVLVAERAAVTRAAEETSQARMAVAGQLLEVQQQMAAGMSSEEASARLRRVVAGLMPAGPDGFDTAAAPTDKVPALVVVSAPEDAPVEASAQDAAAPEDTSARADAAGAEAQPAEENAAAVG